MATMRPRLVRFLSDEEREIMQRPIPRMDTPGHIDDDRVLAMDTEITRLRGALDQVMHELGVPTKDYPAPVANAWDIAKSALNVGVEDN